MKGERLQKRDLFFRSKKRKLENNKRRFRKRSTTFHTCTYMHMQHRHRREARQGGGLETVIARSRIPSIVSQTECALQIC